MRGVIRQRRTVGPLAAGVAWRRLGVVGSATTVGRPAAATSQLVDEDDVLASALDRPESELELELESDDESLDDEESFDESFESDDEPLEDDEEADSFSLRRPLALAPWSFL